MRAGRLRERIRIDSRTSVADGEGGSIEGWAEHAAPRAASIVTKGGSEVLLGERLRGKLMIEIQLRFSSDLSGVSTDMRAVDVRSSKSYNIKTVHVDETKRWMTLTCEGGVAV